MTAACMMGVAEAQRRAAAYYDRHCRAWAADLVVGELFGAEACDEAARPSFSLGLKPPTERQALEAGGKAPAWAAAWRSIDGEAAVDWERRSWSRIGSQDVPCRVRLEGADAIARFAGKGRPWRHLAGRMAELAGTVGRAWAARLPACSADDVRAAVKRSASSYADLGAGDWRMLLLVYEWLATHGAETRYARQLPIRGIDTKWVEQHRGTIDPLVEALSGARPQFAMPPHQVRVRFLDASLAPGGLTDVSVLPAQLGALDVALRVVIVCENLVSVLTLPDLPGVVAIHGGGYSVSSLADVAWLARTRVVYWGDLDSDGFAILNRFRSHVPHAESLMMDAETFEAHRDLAVEDATPNRGELGNLTEPERQALLLVLNGDGPALRLEQERIAWDYALQRLEDSLGL